MVLDEEFALCDINTTKNRNFEYSIYHYFNLHEISDGYYVAEFRLVTALQLPGEIQCGIYNSNLRVSSVEALCVILKRLAFPCRYSDMMPRFARPVPQLSMICNETIHWLDSRSRVRLTDLNQHWLTPQNLYVFCKFNLSEGCCP